MGKDPKDPKAPKDRTVLWNEGNGKVRLISPAEYFVLTKDLPYIVRPEPDKPETDNPPILWVGKNGEDNVLAPAGNINLVDGVPEFSNADMFAAIMAGALREEGDPLCDTLGFYVMPCPKGKCVVHVDAWSSETEYESLMNTTMSRTKYKDGRPEHLHSYQFRPVPIAKRLDTLEKILFDPELPPVHMIFIAGIENLVVVDNEKNGVMLSNLLKDWGKKLKTGITILDTD